MMEAYTSYKKSSVSWAPSIPSHWGEQRGKHLFALMNRPVEKGAETITCFRDGEVTLRRNRRTTGFTESLTEVGYQGIKKGDLVIHQMDAFAGAVGVSDSDGKSTPVYSVCQPKQELSVHYYAYLIREMARSQFILSLSRGIRQRSCDFRFSAFGQCTLLVPPLAEQQKIVDYLDAKCSEIDALVERRERIIEHLQELKQSIIAQAVTRGLNPDTPTKDSGVSWLGCVPEHWEGSRMKYLLGKVQSGDWGQEVSANNAACICVRVADFDYENFRVTNSATPTLRGYRQETIDKLRLEQGDLLLEKSGGGDKSPVGRCVVYCGCQDAVCSNFVEALRVNARVLPEFLMYAISVLYASGHMRYFIKQTTGIQNLQMKRLLAMRLFLPPLEEQKEIVAFLQEKCARIGALVARHRAMKERLKELKTSLIAAAVTGKIDVR